MFEDAAAIIGDDDIGELVPEKKIVWRWFGASDSPSWIHEETEQEEEETWTGFGDHYEEDEGAQNPSEELDDSDLSRRDIMLGSSSPSRSRPAAQR